MTLIHDNIYDFILERPLLYSLVLKMKLTYLGIDFDLHYDYFDIIVVEYEFTERISEFPITSWYNDVPDRCGFLT